MLIPDFDYFPLASYYLTGQKIPAVNITLLDQVDLPSELIHKLNDVELLHYHCYANSVKIAKLSTEEFPIHYVEGEAILPIEHQIVFHAFNYLPKLDAYIDLTWEKLRKDLYQQAYCFPIFNNLISSLIQERNTYPPFWQIWRHEAWENLDESCPMWWMQLENELDFC